MTFMLTFTGSRKRLCDGVTRRDLLHLGGLGLFGLSLTDFFRLQSGGWGRPLWAAPRVGRDGKLGADEASVPSHPPNFGQAKQCILIHLIGAPPQHETFDPKPLAPVEIQGEMK